MKEIQTTTYRMTKQILEIRLLQSSLTDDQLNQIKNDLPIMELENCQRQRMKYVIQREIDWRQSRRSFDRTMSKIKEMQVNLTKQEPKTTKNDSKLEAQEKPTWMHKLTRNIQKLFVGQPSCTYQSEKFKEQETISYQKPHNQNQHLESQDFQQVNSLEESQKNQRSQNAKRNHAQFKKRK